MDTYTMGHMHIEIYIIIINVIDDYFLLVTVYELVIGSTLISSIESTSSS